MSDSYSPSESSSLLCPSRGLTPADSASHFQPGGPMAAQLRPSSKPTLGGDHVGHLIERISWPTATAPSQRATSGATDSRPG